MGPTRHDEIELADAILTGIKRRPTQSFGSYFGPNGGSCALGAAYEGVYLLPKTRTTPCLDGLIGSSIAWRTLAPVPGGLQEADSDWRAHRSLERRPPVDARAGRGLAAWGSDSRQHTGSNVGLN